MSLPMVSWGGPSLGFWGGVLTTFDLFPNTKLSSSLLGALVALLSPTAKCAAVGAGVGVLLVRASRTGAIRD